MSIPIIWCFVHCICLKSVFYFVIWQYRNFISLSVFQDYDVPQHYLNSPSTCLKTRHIDDDSEKNNITYDVTLNYIIFWKVLWQFNNSSRILQEVFWLLTITKWTPKTLTQIKVTFNLSNKYLIGKKKRIFHHFFQTDFSQRVRNSRKNNFTDWWLLLWSINYKYGANGQNIYFLMGELSKVRNFLTGKSWPTDTFLMGESKAKGTFLTWENRACCIR